MIVKGVCPPKFQEVQQVFQNLFNDKEEVGANFAVVQNNEVLINIFGGSKIQMMNGMKILSLTLFH